MYTIVARNVHTALPLALRKLELHGVERESRNGPVRMFDMPVTTLYQSPQQRVMFHPERDCNPFFHLFESLWMLSGRNDVKSVAHYVKRMASFSDDGKIFHGAYGYRWREHFGFDQLLEIIRALKTNPDDRRCVLQMWDARVDLGKQGKDFPCNTQIVFAVSTCGRLDMTVFNRSNDMVWGAYGANAVHFSMLQEFMAAAINVPMGYYWQVSTNFHAYLDTLEKVKVLADWNNEISPYLPLHEEEVVHPFPLITTTTKTWLEDLELYLEHGPIVGFRDPFFSRVVQPMHYAHEAYKNTSDPNRFIRALEIIEHCQASDWRKAAREWLCRRSVSGAGL